MDTIVAQDPFISLYFSIVNPLLQEEEENEEGKCIFDLRIFLTSNLLAPPWLYIVSMVVFTFVIVLNCVGKRGSLVVSVS